MRNILNKLFFPVLVFFVILPLPLWGLSGLSDILLRLPTGGSGSALLGLFLICGWVLGTSALGTFLFARRCLSGLSEGAWLLWGALPAAIAYAVLPMFGAPLNGGLILFLWSGLFGLLGLRNPVRRTDTGEKNARRESADPDRPCPNTPQNDKKTGNENGNDR